ncbi:MAG: TetR/AcrR family transcriptional regulator [Deltaproteobacteria bacterium]|nr:TetR/AcrR family transcriptional regulator [Deltaproteobacteria bacterium]
MNQNDTNSLIRRRPRQARSRATEKRLLDAADTIVEARGFEGLNIADLVRQAEASVGSFYARFGDKDGLLRALYARRMALLFARLEALGNSGTLRAIDLAGGANLLVGEVVRHYRDHAQLVATFHGRCAAQPEAWREAIELHLRLLRKLRDLLCQCGGHSDPNLIRRVDMGLHLVFAFLGERALYGEVARDHLPFEDGELERELSAVLINYVEGARQ